MLAHNVHMIGLTPGATYLSRHVGRSSCWVACAEHLLAALRHATQNPYNTLIILLEPLGIGLGCIGNLNNGTGNRKLLGAKYLRTLEDRKRLERFAVGGRGRDGSEGKSQGSEDGETHDDGWRVEIESGNDRVGD
jgi:hypothetical protein